MILELLLHVVFASISADPLIAGVGPAGEIKEAATGFLFTEGPVAGPEGSLYFSDLYRQRIYQLNADGSHRVVLEKSKICNGLAVDRDGKIIACQGGAGMIISVDPKSGAVSTIASGYQGVRFNQPNDLVLDALGGFYFTDPVYGVPSKPQKTMGLYYVSADKNVTRLAEELDLPNGIGLSPDGKTLYLVVMGAKKVLRFPVEGPGKLGASSDFCTLEAGGDGMTIDAKGNVYVTQPEFSAIDVFHPDGKKLGRLTFPAGPANCAFAGKDGKTLYVTARKSIYAVPMLVSGIIKQE